MKYGRRQEYLKKLFEAYWEKNSNKPTKLYIDINNPYLLDMYAKLGFIQKKTKSSSFYTMERKRNL